MLLVFNDLGCAMAYARLPGPAMRHLNASLALFILFFNLFNYFHKYIDFYVFFL
jgi:hypothetical protein